MFFFLPKSRKPRITENNKKKRQKGTEFSPKNKFPSLCLPCADQCKGNPKQLLKEKKTFLGQSSHCNNPGGDCSWEREYPKSYQKKRLNL